MSRDGGISGRVLAAVSEHALRVAGAVALVLSAGVIAVSLTTDYGLALAGDAATGGGATATAGSVSADALVTFALAHPAYPVAIVLGLALLALGDDAPLLGD